MSSFSPNVPTRPSAPGRRRWGLLVVGIVVSVIATLVLVVAAVVSGVSVVNSTSDPIAEARTPDTLTFVAETQGYQITIRSGFEDMAASVECSVERADGSSAVVDGDIQSASFRVGAVQTVGTFKAAEGTTAVTCLATADGVPFQVIEENDAGLTITIMLSGGAFLVVGVAFILVGVFTRKRAV